MNCLEFKSLIEKNKGMKFEHSFFVNDNLFM